MMMLMRIFRPAATSGFVRCPHARLLSRASVITPRERNQYLRPIAVSMRKRSMTSGAIPSARTFCSFANQQNQKNDNIHNTEGTKGKKEEDEAGESSDAIRYDTKPQTKNMRELSQAIAEIDSTRVRVVQSAPDARFHVPVVGTTGLLSQAEIRPSSIKQVVVLEVGEEGSRQHGYFYFTEDQYVLSPWHDVPLYPMEHILRPQRKSNLVNMVVAMPKHTSQRFELKVQHAYTPLGPEYLAAKSPLLKPNPRYCKFDSYFFNEGLLTQTWADPDELALDTKWPGHDGPLHVCEIGSASLDRGQLAEVKILGVLGVIQRPFLVWKLIAINSNDPKAPLFDDITDVEDHCPGLLDEIREFYRLYETPEGRPVYEFVFSGEFRDKVFAMEVIRQGHECWRLGCEEEWDIGTKNPDLHFKWFTRSAENLVDTSDEGSLAFLRSPPSASSSSSAPQNRKAKADTQNATQQSTID